MLTSYGGTYKSKTKLTLEMGACHREGGEDERNGSRMAVEIYIGSIDRLTSYSGDNEHGVVPLINGKSRSPPLFPGE